MTTSPLAAHPDLVLQARGLRVTYGDVVAVDGVSLQARAGEILGLLGPNGAGKTSVIRALTTILPLAGGEARVAGHPLTEPDAVRAAIGVLPESNGYPPGQTAPAYLRFHGQLFGLPRSEADRRAEELLGQLGLGGVRTRIGTFSRGMRQRLGLARAMINEPALLFLDEPTLGLDPAGQDEILQHLTRAATRRGTCVVLCSHLLDEVERVCDRVAIMHHARVVAEGTVGEVVAAAGVADRGSIHVAPAELARARRLLGAVLADASGRVDETRPGDLAVRLPSEDGAAADLLRRLLDAGIAPQAFDLRGGRLSEAFLALTSRSRGDRP